MKDSNVNNTLILIASGDDENGFGWGVSCKGGRNSGGKSAVRQQRRA